MTIDIDLPLHDFSVDPTSGGIVDLWFKANAGPHYCGFSFDSDMSVHFTDEPGDDVRTTITDYWSGLSSDSPEHTVYLTNQSINAIKKQVEAAQVFANDLLVHLDAENLVMGITADGKTDDVLEIMTPALVALQSASLTSAIKRLKAVSPSAYDAKYITAARLLIYVNKIEAYLGIPLSTSLT